MKKVIISLSLLVLYVSPCSAAPLLFEPVPPYGASIYDRNDANDGMRLPPQARGYRSDDEGGVWTPDGRHYRSDDEGGLWTPDGRHYRSDGNGGYYRPDGRHITPDGQGGFYDF